MLLNHYKNGLIIFVKYPQPGLVKTRLAKDIGPKGASLVYRQLAETVLAKTKDKEFERFIFYHPPERQDEIRSWLGEGLELYPQRGPDLGSKLSNAVEAIFKKGAKRVVAIGTDSPAVDSKVVKEAFLKLEEVQCVIGPSRDGGYYLIGMSSFMRELFEGIDWSTDRVLAQTIKVLKRLEAGYTLLEESFDVDRYEDLSLIKR